MKKAFVFLCGIAFLVLSSCNTEGSTEENSLNLKSPNSKFINDYVLSSGSSLTNLASRLPGPSSGGPCDYASSVGVSVETDFELHRPKYDCLRGFWFCSTTHYYYNCYDANGDLIYQEEIRGNYASGSNLPKHKYTIGVKYFESTNEILLTFPKQTLIDNGYTSEDLSQFSVDDEIESVPGSGIYFVKGDYDVFEYNNSLLVLVDTKIL